jgi:hypothetical protein
VGEVLEHEPPLYLAAGISTAKEFLARYTHESVRSAQRFVRVAKYASPHDEERYGEAKGRVPVDFAALRIPVKRDGETRRLTLEEVSVDEIRAATRTLAKKKPSKAQQSPVLDAVRKALPAALRKEVTLSVAKNALTIGRIPLAKLRELGLAMAKVKLP